MLELLFMGMQDAVAADRWSLQAAPAIDLHAVRRCPDDQAGDDVIVCGSSNPDRYRLTKLPPTFEKDRGPPLAQTGIGGGTVGVVTQQVMIGNVPSNRVMVSLKLPF